MALIVEVLHPRTGAVVSRRRIAATPFTIGRALDNTLVLDDPHVDARHAVIVVQPETGDHVIEDAGSLNGVHTLAHGRSPRLRLISGSEVQVGRTTLRIRDDADPVAPALPLRASGRAAGTSDGRTFARLVYCAAVFVGAGFLAWLGTYGKSSMGEALALGLGMAALAAFWAGVWAIVARVVIHQGRFVAHLTIATSLILFGTVVGVAGGWVEFLWPDSTVWEAVSFIIGVAVVPVAVALHLAHASHLSPMRRWRAGAVVGAVIVALVGVFSLAEDDDAFTDVPVFSASVQTLRPSLVPQLDPAGLKASHAALREKVDKLVDEAETP